MNELEDTLFDELAPTSQPGTLTRRALDRWEGERRAPRTNTWLTVGTTAAVLGGAGAFLHRATDTAPSPVDSPVIAAITGTPTHRTPRHRPMERRQPHSIPAHTIDRVATVRPMTAVKRQQPVANTPKPAPISGSRMDDLKAINGDSQEILQRWAGGSPPPTADTSTPDFISIAPPALAGADPTQATEALRIQQREKEIVDARLQTKLTVGVGALAFSELCAELSRKSGIELTAGAAVADDKITLYCTDKPLREIMRQVNRVFGFTWERSGTEGAYRYKLIEPLKAKLAEEELRNRSNDEALADLDSTLKRLGALAELSPSALREKMENARDEEERRELRMLSMRGYGPAKLFGNLPPDAIEALRSGKTLEFRGNPKRPDQLSLSAKQSKELLSAFDATGRVVTNASGPPTVSVGDMGPLTSEGVSPGEFPGASAMAWMELRRDEQGQLTLYGGTGIEADGAGMMCNTAVATGISPSSRSPENAKLHAGEKNDPALKGSISGLKKRLAELKVPEDSATTAEVLEALHRKTGKDIIADSFTLLVGLNSLPVAGASLFDTLCHTADTCRMRWEREGEWLRFRTATFYNERPKEISNTLWRRWSEKRKELDTLPIETLCELARLNNFRLESGANAQYAARRQKLTEWHWVSRQRDHWRFLAALAPAQRQLALSSTGVAFRNLSLSQQQQFFVNAFGSNTSQWPDPEYQREAVFRFEYTLAPKAEEPKLLWSYDGLRRTTDGPALSVTEDERFNRYGPRPKR